MRLEILALCCVPLDVSICICFLVCPSTRANYAIALMQLSAVVRVDKHRQQMSYDLWQAELDCLMLVSIDHETEVGVENHLIMLEVHPRLHVSSSFSY